MLIFVFHYFFFSRKHCRTLPHFIINENLQTLVLILVVFINTTINFQPESWMWKRSLQIMHVFNILLCCNCKSFVILCYILLLEIFIFYNYDSFDINGQWFWGFIARALSLSLNDYAIYLPLCKKFLRDWIFSKYWCTLPCHFAHF